MDIRIIFYNIYTIALMIMGWNARLATCNGRKEQMKLLLERYSRKRASIYVAYFINKTTIESFMINKVF